MSRFLVSALGAAVLLGALSTLALAGQPDPNQSTWGNLVGCSPKNLTTSAPTRYSFTGTIRDGAGAPIANFPASQLELDFGACTNPSTRPADQIAADGDSNVNGGVTWSTNLNFGGGDPCQVRVLVQNVVFKTLISDGTNPGGIDGGVRSVDQNGDGSVALTDLAQFQQEFVNTGVRHDYRGDFGPTFDGQTGLTDLATFQSHFVAPN
jgi:hypothetical protein